MEEDVPVRGVKSPEEEFLGEDEFLAFVKSQVEYMEGFLKIGAGREISFYELEEALKGYTHVHLSLLAMANIARIEHARMEEDYNQWYAERFVFIRAKHNLTEKSAQKWASQRELDCLVRVEYASEFKERKKALLESEQKYTFISGLVKIWEGYSYTLNKLSDNVHAELNTQGLENRL